MHGFRKVIVVFAGLVLVSCATYGPKPPKYESLSDTALMYQIYEAFLLPSAFNTYKSDRLKFESKGLTLQDVAIKEATCISKYLAKNALRTDLEVIHELWVVGKGYNADKIIQEKGEHTYKAAVQKFVDASFEYCPDEVKTWVNRR